MSPAAVEAPRKSRKKGRDHEEGDEEERSWEIYEGGLALDSLRSCDSCSQH